MFQRDYSTFSRMLKQRRKEEGSSNVPVKPVSLTPKDGRAALQDIENVAPVEDAPSKGVKRLRPGSQPKPALKSRASLGSIADQPARKKKKRNRRASRVSFGGAGLRVFEIGGDLSKTTDLGTIRLNDVSTASPQAQPKSNDSSFSSTGSSDEFFSPMKPTETQQEKPQVARPQSLAELAQDTSDDDKEISMDEDESAAEDEESNEDPIDVQGDFGAPSARFSLGTAALADFIGTGAEPRLSAVSEIPVAPTGLSSFEVTDNSQMAAPVTGCATEANVSTITMDLTAVIPNAIKEQQPKQVELPSHLAQHFPAVTTEASMDLTSAFGCILASSPVEEQEREANCQESPMQMTKAHTALLETVQQIANKPNVTEVTMDFTGVVPVSREDSAADDVEEVTMDFTGAHGKILEVARQRKLSLSARDMDLTGAHGKILEVTDPTNERRLSNTADMERRVAGILGFSDSTTRDVTALLPTFEKMSEATRQIADMYKDVLEMTGDMAEADVNRRLSYASNQDRTDTKQSSMLPVSTEAGDTCAPIPVTAGSYQERLEIGAVSTECLAGESIVNFGNIRTVQSVPEAYARQAAIIQSSADQLQGHVVESVDALSRMEQHVAEYTPKIFGQLSSANEAQLEDFKQQARLLRKHCESGSLKEWLEWGKGVLENVLEDLKEQKDHLHEQDQLVESLTQAADRALQFTQRCSDPSVSSMREEIAEQSSVIGEFLREVETLRNTRSKLEDRVESMQQEGSALQEAIKLSVVRKTQLREALIQANAAKEMFRLETLAVDWRPVRVAASTLVLQYDDNYCLTIDWQTSADTTSIASIGLTSSAGRDKLRRGLFATVMPQLSVVLAKFPEALQATTRSLAVQHLVTDLETHLGRLDDLYSDIQTVMGKWNTELSKEGDVLRVWFTSKQRKCQTIVDFCFNPASAYPFGQLPCRVQTTAGKIKADDVALIVEATQGFGRFPRICRELQHQVY